MYGGGGGELGGSSWKAPEEANVVIGGGTKFDEDVSSKNSRYSLNYTVKRNKPLFTLRPKSQTLIVF